MICLKCNEPLIRFGNYKCKNCRSIYLLKWSNENRENLNKLSREWVEKNKEKRKQVRIKSEIKNREIRLLKRRIAYSEGRVKTNYKTNPMVRREIKYRYRARKLNTISEKYSVENIFKKYNYKCYYCSDRATELDHVIPLCRGGMDVEDNLVPSCKSCNCSKGSKTVIEWTKMKLGML